MCHLTIEIDQAIHSVRSVFDAVEESAFFICSVRVSPVAWSRKADVHLSLGGGSNRDLNALLQQLNSLPAVLSTIHSSPPV